MSCNRCGDELNYPQESHSDLCVDCAKLNRIESGGDSSSTSRSWAKRSEQSDSGGEPSKPDMLGDKYSEHPSESELPTAAHVVGSLDDEGIERIRFNPYGRSNCRVGDELVRLEDIPDWLTQKEQEILNREHGKMSYRDEGVVKAVFHILRKELVGEDPELFHEVKASAEKKSTREDDA